MISHQEVRRLSSKFGIQVKRVRVIQMGVYRIMTSKGQEYCLKRMAYPPARIRWIDRTLQHMRRNSSIKLGWRDPTQKSGKLLFVKNRKGEPFVFVPWLNGSWPSPRSKAHMRECGTFLVKFHQAGNKIKISKNGMSNKKRTWPALLHFEHSRLKKAISKANRNGFHSYLDQLLQQHGNEILIMARASIRSLRNSNYRSICRKTKATLCHGDGGPTNFIRTSRGMYLIDFETMRLDLRAYDLYRVIYNSCQNHNWNFAIARSILDGYQKVYKLKPSDYRMLKVLLRFPRGICKLIADYEFKSQTEKRQVERDFPKILAHERRRSAFLKKLDQYAR